MKLILITLLLLFPTIAYANIEAIELIFMLEDLGVLNESEVFNLIFNELIEW
jgi:hypothetical protein